MKMVWGGENHKPVDQRLNFIKRGCWRGRDGEKQSCWVVLSEGLNGRLCGGAGGDAIINEEQCFIAQIWRGVRTSVQRFAPLEFCEFPTGDGIDDVRLNVQRCDRVVMEDADAARGDGAHRKFRVRRDAEFAYDKNIQRCMEDLCHFESDRDASSRDSEH